MGHEVATNGSIIKKNIKGVTGEQCGSGRLVKKPPGELTKASTHA